MKLQIALARSGLGELYHITNNRAALGILQHDEFQLKPSEGTEAEELLGNSYYLSTTRSKVGGYTQRSLGQHSVIFVLNASKLSTKYKLRPVEYWSNMLDDMNRANHGEQEERVMSQSPRITKASMFISAIHAFVPEADDRTDRRMFLLHKIALMKKIPIFFYDDRKAMLLQDTRKAIKPKFSAKEPEPAEYTQYHYKYRVRKNALFPYIELYHTPATAEMRKKLSEGANILIRRLYSLDADAVLRADMHYEKGTEYGSISKGREALDKLVDILRKNKWTTKQFLQHLFDKWSKS